MGRRCITRPLSLAEGAIDHARSFVRLLWKAIRLACWFWPTTPIVIRAVASNLQQAAAVRVAPFAAFHVYAGGQQLNLEHTVKEAGLQTYWTASM